MRHTQPSWFAFATATPPGRWPDFDTGSAVAAAGPAATGFQSFGTLAVAAWPATPARAFSPAPLYLVSTASGAQFCL